LVLWFFGLLRTGLGFFYILILSGFVGVALSAINVIVYYDPHFMPRLLGAWGFAIFFYVYTWLLLVNFIVSLIGSAFMVRWICRARPANDHRGLTSRSSQPLTGA
jgi:hypothetical protein